MRRFRLGRQRLTAFRIDLLRQFPEGLYEALFIPQQKLQHLSGKKNPVTRGEMLVE